MATIMVVDDSSSVRNEVGEYLRGHGIDVNTAIDGVDGFEKIQMDPDLKLVICDVNMPNMDGLTMVETLRGAGNPVTIIMLTTEDDPVIKQRGKSAGVKGWIVKPFNDNSIINAIKKLIE